jgi:hypothetical protein
LIAGATSICKECNHVTLLLHVVKKPRAALLRPRKIHSDQQHKRRMN